MSVKLAVSATGSGAVGPGTVCVKVFASRASSAVHAAPASERWRSPNRVMVTSSLPSGSTVICYRSSRRFLAAAAWQMDGEKGVVSRSLARLLRGKKEP